MYVRCPIDHDMINPRDFLMGQITKIDSFADTVEVVFNDPFNYRVYYANFPKTAPLPISMVQRCQFFVGSIVLYEKEKYKIVSCVKKEDVFYDYYIENLYDKSLFVLLKIELQLLLQLARLIRLLSCNIMNFKILAGCLAEVLLQRQ